MSFWSVIPSLAVVIAVVMYILSCGLFAFLSFGCESSWCCQLPIPEKFSLKGETKETNCKDHAFKIKANTKRGRENPLCIHTLSYLLSKLLFSLFSFLVKAFADRKGDPLSIARLIFTMAYKYIVEMCRVEIESGTSTWNSVLHYTFAPSVFRYSSWTRFLFLLSSPETPRAITSFRISVNSFRRSSSSEREGGEEEISFFFFFFCCCRSKEFYKFWKPVSEGKVHR